VIDNLLMGKGTWDIGVAAVFRSNPLVQPGDFADPAAGDFRLNSTSRARGKASDPGSANGIALQPTREYRHPTHTVSLESRPAQPGAIQTLNR
jgi:hypothetical protein